MTVLVAGAAGFIGFDNLNPDDDPALKRARLARQQRHPVRWPGLTSTASA